MTDTPVWIAKADAPTTVTADDTHDAPANPSLLSVTTDAPAPVARTSGEGERPAAAATTQPGRDPQQYLDEIKVQKADLARLYDKNTGLLIEKMPDGQPATIVVEGQRLTTAQYRDMVVTNISRLYEGAIDAAKTGRAPGNDARISTERRSVEAMEKELKDKYGIELQKGIGGKLTTYTVEQTMEATTNVEAKKLLGAMRDSMLGITTAAVNQNAPDKYTMDYADFLRTMGLTKQADTLLAGIDQNTVARYSNQYEQLSTQITTDFATARGKLVPAENDPLATLAEARKRMAAGDNAGAEAAFAKAYQQYDALPQDKMAAEIKRLTDASAAIDKQATEMEASGLLTPAKAAAFEMQKQQLLVVQANWEQLQASKHSVQLVHAHYLVTQSATKDTPETRHKAQEMLDEVRYTDRGKLAMMMDFQQGGEQRFTNDLMLAGEGKPQSAQAMNNYLKSMQEAAKLYAEADALRDPEKASKDKAAQAAQLTQEANMLQASNPTAAQERRTAAAALAKESNDLKGKKPDEDAASKKLMQARMNAENARNDASHIDTGEAKYQLDQVKKNLQRLVDAEKAKPTGERNEQKLALLQHMQKPKNEQDPATVALLDNLLNPPEKMDAGKLQKLKQILGDEYSVMEVAQLHATAADANMRVNAANGARMFMLQIDVETGKGENNPLTKEIEDHDPDGSFRAQLDWGKVKEATRDIGFWEGLWNGTKDIAIGLVSGLVAVGGFLLVTLPTVGWGAPAGVAVGLAAGTATYCALKGLSGDKVTLWTAGEGLVNSAAALVTMGTGGAIAGQLGKTALARGVTLFGAGMAGNMTYHAGMESIHYGQGYHPDFLSAMKSAGGQSLADAPYVALFAALGGKFGGKQFDSAFSRSLKLDVTPSVARQVFSQWGVMTGVYSPSVMEEQRRDAAISRHYQRMIDKQGK